MAINPMSKTTDQFQLFRQHLKYLKKIMFVHILNQVKHLLSHKQHGFVKNKSTITNLAEYVNYIATYMPKGGQIDAIYTDLAKAFDKVNHRRLLKKLNQYPIDNCTKAWIFSFLTKIKQTVCIYGNKSKPISPTSSVPQGCILSTLLFALFINDLSCKYGIFLIGGKTQTPTQ